MDSGRLRLTRIVVFTLTPSSAVQLLGVPEFYAAIIAVSTGPRLRGPMSSVQVQDTDFP